MFCVNCGTTLDSSLAACSGCGTTTSQLKSVSKDVGNKVKAASSDAWSAFKVLAVNPVGGLAQAFESLGRKRAMGVGIVFGVVFAFALVVTLTVSLGRANCAEGRIGPDDLIWTRSFGDSWRRAGDVPDLQFSGPEVKPTDAGLVPRPTRSSGTRLIVALIAVALISALMVVVFLLSFSGTDWRGGQQPEASILDLLTPVNAERSQSPDVSVLISRTGIHVPDEPSRTVWASEFYVTNESGRLLEGVRMSATWECAGKEAGDDIAEMEPNPIDGTDVIPPGGRAVFHPAFLVDFERLVPPEGGVYWSANAYRALQDCQVQLGFREGSKRLSFSAREGDPFIANADHWEPDGEEIGSAPEARFFVDSVGLLERRDTAPFEEQLAGFYKRTGKIVAVKVVSDTDGASIEDFVETTQGEFLRAKGDCVLIHVIHDGRYKVTAGSSVKALFPDDFCEVVVGDLDAGLRRGEHREAFSLALQRVTERFERPDEEISRTVASQGPDEGLSEEEIPGALARAEVGLRLEEWSAAEVTYRLVLAATNGRAELKAYRLTALIGRGMALASMGRAADAEASFREAVSLDARAFSDFSTKYMTDKSIPHRDAILAAIGAAK
jgi:uncharacterized membrane protein YgcG